MGPFANFVPFLTLDHDVFLWFYDGNSFHVTSPQKQVTNVSIVLKDSDTESENLSSLIRLSVLDGQKQTVKRHIIYGYVIICSILTSIYAVCNVN